MYTLPEILRDKTMADKYMYISNDDKQNYHFCRLLVDTASFNEPIKSCKYLKLCYYYKVLVLLKFNSPMSPPSLTDFIYINFFHLSIKVGQLVKNKY